MPSNYTFRNVVSSAPNPNVGYCNSWIEVQNNAGRPLYAEASYITNLDDINISLSASNVDIGAVHIIDKDTGLAASIADVGTGLGAMRVLSQDLEPFHDTISIGDTNGNLAYVTSSALNVFNTNPISLKDVNGNNVSVTVPTSSLNVNVTNTTTSITTPSPTQLDAFGRLRVSTPLTLFDSSHRYRDNNLWSSLTAVGGSYVFNQNQGLVDLTVNSLSGSSVIRETTKVFSYQPGKSLLALNTFVFAPSTNNLRQRVGYFGKDNGIYFQLDDGVMSFVERTLVNGSPATENIIPLSAWNGDKLDGTGASGFTLDITKAQIMWMDIEWLGLGTVRVGFIIEGKYIICHSFHHANRLASTYITTASLPLRYEITNKGATSGSKTMKQVCSSVISEGGYELRGLQQAVGIPVDAPKRLATKGVFYPVITTRLKSSKNDAIVILTAISILGKSLGAYNWKVIASGTTSGGSGTWISAGDDSAVEYKLDATVITGGRTLASGYCTTSNQGSTQVDVLKEALFKFQFERDSLNGVNYELTLAMASDTDTSDVFASMDWEEISR
ncbi:MAG: hypothetical protein EBU90_01180 [Proteobacteria bacterium]|nr:hypothetical protein [Pseudomonadota bacterium]NBP13030.1 hypothetical protein [bacterium]